MKLKKKEKTEEPVVNQENDFYGSFKDKEEKKEVEFVQKKNMILDEETKTNFLDSHTVVTNESKRSRAILIGFYVLLIIVCGISICLLLFT